jgi:ribosomal protein S18 acetylase RimI-like enzyme
MRAVLHRSAEPALPMGVVVRRLRPDDASALGSLMVSAYAGTVDDHGQPPECHASEARRTIAGEYGAMEWDSSLLATLDRQLIGATVVTLDRAHLLLAFALVSPEWRNRGLGTALVIRSGNRLSAMGATEWTLAVTVGNPAQRLYERVGFRVDRSLC